MSIYLLTGVPGSGKSYYAVTTIADILKSEKKLLILHNIEGLSIQDNRVISFEWSSDDFNADILSVKLLELRKDYGLTDQDKIYFFIDEAQRFFPPELKDGRVLYFFDYHRHFGCDIYLISQHEKKISYKITTLAEKEVRAVNSHVNPFGSFLYKHRCGGEEFATSRLSRDKKIFALYKSFQAGDGKQTKSKLRYILFIIPILVPCLFYLYLKLTAERFSTSKPDKLNTTAEHIVSSENINEDKNIFMSSTKSNLTPTSNLPVQDKPPVLYLAPKIENYNSDTDVLYLKADDSILTVQLTVIDFVKKYPPDLYGYGYIHAPHKRFILTTADCSRYIYPVENPVFARSFIKNEPDTGSSLPSKPLPPPVEWLDKSNMPDKHGYTRSDYLRAFKHAQGIYDEENKTPPDSTNATLLNLDLTQVTP